MAATATATATTIPRTLLSTPELLTDLLAAAAAAAAVSGEQVEDDYAALTVDPWDPFSLASLAAHAQGTPTAGGVLQVAGAMQRTRQKGSCLFLGNVTRQSVGVLAS